MSEYFVSGSLSVVLRYRLASQSSVGEVLGLVASLGPTATERKRVWAQAQCHDFNPQPTCKNVVSHVDARWGAGSAVFEATRWRASGAGCRGRSIRTGEAERDELARGGSEGELW